MMSIDDAVEWAEMLGLGAGTADGPYSPPLTPGICGEADDAYCTGYFRGLAYLSAIRDAR